MTSFLPLTAINLLAILIFVFVQWIFSLRLRDASIVDRFWGAGFVVIAISTFVQQAGYEPRAWLLLVMTAVWGLRLSIYLTWRNWGAGEDYRYRAMRERHGDRFPLVSLGSVFVLQGLLTYVISMPIQAGIYASAPPALTVAAWIGVAVWLIGLAFESVGDVQLARFKSNPENKGRVLDTGLWRYTRHPNYFGDALVWWGLFFVAAPVPYGIFTVAGPVVMTYFLRRISGVTLLERRLKATKPGYDDYIARTSAFIPRPPKRGGESRG